VKIEHGYCVWDRSLNSRSNASIVDLGSFFPHPTPTTSPLPPQLAPNCGAPPNQVPLPSPEGCGPASLVNGWIWEGGTEGDPRSRRPRQCVARTRQTKVVSRSRCSYLSNITSDMLGLDIRVREQNADSVEGHTKAQPR